MKDIFFAFGPADSYFFASAPSCRHKNFDYLINTYPDAARRTWVAISPDSQEWYYSYIDKEREQWRVVSFDQTMPNLTTWLDHRQQAHRRLVLGANQSYVAWVPHAGHLVSPYAPKSVQELINSATTFYTNIRMCALGVDETYVIIWEDGTIRWDLKTHYKRLDEVLENIRGKGDEVSFIALNASKADDYFVYFDSEKLALFQVSGAFSTDLEEVLKAQGIRSKAIVRRTEKMAKALPPTILKDERGKNFLKGVAKSVGVGANLLAIGASIAGLAACSVM